jgi:hypothetical protein
MAEPGAFFVITAGRAVAYPHTTALNPPTW